MYLTTSLQDTQIQATTHSVSLDELLLVIDELPVDLPRHSRMTWSEVALHLRNTVTEVLHLLQEDYLDKDPIIMRLKGHKLLKFLKLREHPYDHL